MVFLKPPNENESTVCAGTAVIDSGPYTGQRIEFEAEQCFLFGYCLSRADLSFIFRASKYITLSFVCLFECKPSSKEMK